MKRIRPFLPLDYLPLWLLNASALFFFASVSHATPPAVIDVWFDAERVHRAASVFGDEERKWFEMALKKISGPNKNIVHQPPVPMVGVRSSHELDRALIGLICPSLERGEVGKIQEFLSAVNKQRLVRGRGNYEGWTVVSYRLLQESGQPWRLEARHQNVSGPSASAKPLRKQTGPAFLTYIDCAQRKDK